MDGCVDDRGLHGPQHLSPDARASASASRRGQDPRHPLALRAPAHRGDRIRDGSSWVSKGAGCLRDTYYRTSILLGVEFPSVAWIQSEVNVVIQTETMRGIRSLFSARKCAYSTCAPE